MRNVVLTFLALTALSVLGCGGNLAFRDEIMRKELSKNEQGAKAIYVEIFSHASRSLKAYMQANAVDFGRRLQRNHHQNGEIRNIVDQLIVQDLFAYVPYVRENLPSSPLLDEKNIEAESRLFVFGAKILLGAEADSFHSCLADISLAPQPTFNTLIDSTLSCWTNVLSEAGKTESLRALLRTLLAMKEMSRLSPLQ